MSRKAIKTINWAALAERIPESEKTTLAAFRAKSEQYLRRLVKRGVRMNSLFLEHLPRYVMYLNVRVPMLK